MNSTYPKVGIVIVNWNNYPDTERCLSSLSEVEYPNYTVYVVDNGSTDNSGEKLSNKFEYCEFIFNKANYGFAGGNNPAIKRALEEGADYVLLLNNDARVNSSFLSPLVETAERNQDAAAIGGVIFDEEGDVWSAGGRFSPTLVKLSHRKDPDDDVYETDFISGAMILLDRQFLEHINLLNEEYFFGMEDEELAWEAKSQGKRLLINTDSMIYHDGGGTASEANAFRYYHDARNRLLFASENLSLHRKVTFYCFFVVSRLIRFSQWSLTSRFDLINATLQAVADVVLSRDPRKPSEFK